MINDITALRSDPGLGPLAAESGVPVVLMHMQGEPRTMQVAPRYDDLVAEIRLFLQQAADAAEERGVPRARLIVALVKGKAGCRTPPSWARVVDLTKEAPRYDG